MTPPEHSVTLLDENLEAIDFDRCARADIVGLTGMVVQRGRMLEILAELNRRGAFVVVEGAWVTVKEDDFDGLADVVFIGDAEQTWPRFLDEWQRGEHGRRYEQTERTDMSTVPTPRFDMLNMKDHLFGNVQFTRGCPFQCEFCDIIVTFSLQGNPASQSIRPRQPGRPRVAPRVRLPASKVQTSTGSFLVHVAVGCHGSTIGPNSRILSRRSGETSSPGRCGPRTEPGRDRQRPRA